MSSAAPPEQDSTNPSGPPSDLISSLADAPQAAEGTPAPAEPEKPAPDINQELAQARERAIARSKSGDPNAKEEGAFSKVVGWFKSLFGG